MKEDNGGYHNAIAAFSIYISPAYTFNEREFLNKTLLYSAFHTAAAAISDLKTKQKRGRIRSPLIFAYSLTGGCANLIPASQGRW